MTQHTITDEQLKKVRNILENVGICINIQTVHDAIDKALRELDTIEKQAESTPPAAPSKEVVEAIWETELRFLHYLNDQWNVMAEKYPDDYYRYSSVFHAQLKEMLVRHTVKAAQGGNGGG